MFKKNKKVKILESNTNKEEEPNLQAPIFDAASVDAYIRNLEKTLNQKLQENMNFQQIVLLAGEKKYHNQLINSSLFE